MLDKLVIIGIILIMKDNSDYKKIMLESGKVSPTSFADDPNWQDPYILEAFFNALDKHSYLEEKSGNQIDLDKFISQLKNKQGNLYEQVEKITKSQLETFHKKQLNEGEDADEFFKQLGKEKGPLYEQFQKNRDVLK